MLYRSTAVSGIVSRIWPPPRCYKQPLLHAVRKLQSRLEDLDIAKRIYSVLYLHDIHFKILFFCKCRFSKVSVYNLPKPIFQNSTNHYITTCNNKYDNQRAQLSWNCPVNETITSWCMVERCMACQGQSQNPPTSHWNLNRSPFGKNTWAYHLIWPLSILFLC